MKKVFDDEEIKGKFVTCNVNGTKNYGIVIEVDMYYYYLQKLYLLEDKVYFDGPKISKIPRENVTTLDVYLEYILMYDFRMTIDEFADYFKDVIEADTDCIINWSNIENARQLK